ncbi:hypothetical protein, partial [Salmonella enterica]|uniref:hypothetical protein n=1 Tax=Salmonella enterica TaxID=28901 RepID=UPI0016023966
MSDIDALQALTSQMTQEGIRRLLVISGDAAWCRERAEAIRAALPGDWLLSLIHISEPTRRRLNLVCRL